MKVKQLSKKERDALREVMSIGLVNASAALSSFINQKVVISVPEFRFSSVETMPEFVVDREELVTAVLLNMRDGLCGTMMLLFRPDSALTLLELLTNNHKDNIRKIDDFDKSALCEAGNILTGACTSVLSDFLGLNILQSIPDVVTDMVGALFSAILSDMGQFTDSVFDFKVNFSIEEKKIEGNLIFMFETHATKKIVRILKNKNNKK
jgi:chemotaxis protein CheC